MISTSEITTTSSKNSPVLGVLRVESDMVSFSAVWLKNGSVFAKSERTIPLMMATSDRLLSRMKCEDPSVHDAPVTTSAFDTDVSPDSSHEFMTSTLTTGNITAASIEPTINDPTASGPTSTDEKPTVEGLTNEGPTKDDPTTSRPTPTDEDPKVSRPTPTVKEPPVKRVTNYGLTLSEKAQKKARNCEILRIKESEPGHVEQDPDRIWEKVHEVIDEVFDTMAQIGVSIESMHTVGVVNEMGTLLSWHADTGVKIHNAIHWTDVRMDTGVTGAVSWLSRHSDAVRCAGDRCMFGTLDAWITWKLTLGRTYETDVTNASYTGLLDLATLDWNHAACRAAGLKKRTWPTVRAHLRHVATVQVGRLTGRSLQATIARPGAVLLGQRCFHRGLAAVTVTDRAAVVICPCDKKRALAAKNRMDGVGPTAVVGYLQPDPTDENGSTVVYALMAVSKGPARVCLGLQHTLTPDGQIYSAMVRTPANARVVLCIGDREGPQQFVTAATDSVCHGVAYALTCAVRGSGTASAIQVFVDGPYGEYDAVLQRLADVSGVPTHKSLTDVTCNGVTHITAVANANHATPRQFTNVFEPTSSRSQRDAWRDDFLRMAVLSYGWAALPPSCIGPRTNYLPPFDAPPLDLEPQTLYQYVSSTVRHAVYSVREFFEDLFAWFF